MFLYCNALLASGGALSDPLPPSLRIARVRTGVTQAYPTIFHRPPSLQVLLGSLAPWLLGLTDTFTARACKHTIPMYVVQRSVQCGARPPPLQRYRLQSGLPDLHPTPLLVHLVHRGTRKAHTSGGRLVHLRVTAPACPTQQDLDGSHWRGNTS